MEEKICLRVCGDFFTGLFSLREKGGSNDVHFIGDWQLAFLTKLLPVNVTILYVLNLLPYLDESITEPGEKSSDFDERVVSRAKSPDIF